jgi:hypothetical protein
MRGRAAANRNAILAPQGVASRETRVSEEIHKADANLKRTAAIVLGVTAVVLALSVAVSMHWLDIRTATLDPTQAAATFRTVATAAMLFTGVCLLLLGLYLLHRSQRIIEERRFPTSNTRVIRDTPVRRDAAALRIGRQVRWASISACVLALLLPGIGLLWLAQFV